MLLSAIALLLVGPVTPSIRKRPSRSLMPEASPEAGRLGQQLEAGVALEVLVFGGVDVADHRVGDIRVDVEGGGPAGQ